MNGTGGDNSRIGVALLAPRGTRRVPLPRLDAGAGLLRAVTKTKTTLMVSAPGAAAVLD